MSGSEHFQCICFFVASSRVFLPSGLSLFVFVCLCSKKTRSMRCLIKIICMREYVHARWAVRFRSGRSMKAVVFSAVLILITISCVHRCSCVLPCVPRTQTPTFVNSACPTQTGLSAVTNQIGSNMETLVSTFQNCLASLGTAQDKPATSCQQIYSTNNSRPNGQYWVTSATGNAVLVYCRFDAFTSFSSFSPLINNGFVALSSLNMLDASQPPCPTPLKLYTSSGVTGLGRLCSKNAATSCASLTIPTFGLSYQTVCGKVAGYEIGSDNAFKTSASNNIDSYYVDGISITYGNNPRRHIWTYAASISQTTGGSSNTDTSTCPCTGSGQAPPSFVGSNYYCESGNPQATVGTAFYNDLLWDGKNCGTTSASCCTDQRQPWFCNRLTSPIVGDLEMRVCTDDTVANEDVAIQSFEFYVQ